MKQLFKYFSMIMMVAVMTVTFSSCKDDKDGKELESTNLVGRWECMQQDDDGTSFKMVLTFNSDATGTIEEALSTKATYAYSMKFTWSTTTNANGDDILRVSYVDGDKTTELFMGSSSTVLWTRKYVLTGKILNVYDGDGVWVFNKK